MNNDDYAALVAFDWGNTEHAFALRRRDGTEELGSIPATAEDLHGWLGLLGERCGQQPVALALEGGRNAVVHALLAYPWLEIYPIHPATSDRFRKAFTPSGAKDDLPDAQVLLTILVQHRDQLRRLVPDTAQTRELAALNELRRRAVDRRTQLAVELISTLKTCFPQALELCGRNLWTPLALDLLERWPELALLQKAKPATLRRFYYTHSSRRPTVVDERLVFVATARPLTADRAVLNPAVRKVRLLVAVLRPLQQQIEQVETEIAACFAAHPEVGLFRHLPGAGPALAPRLLVAFGTDRTRYPDAASLQKYAGVAPVKVKSGHQLWTHWRWNASIFLRQTFVEWAGQTVPKCPWAKAYYLLQKRAGKNHQTILRALAFKWIRILWRCWQDRVPYDGTRYLAALHRRHSPLAAPLSPN
jgi:transposase